MTYFFLSNEILYSSEVNYKQIKRCLFESILIFIDRGIHPVKLVFGSTMIYNLNILVPCYIYVHTNSKNHVEKHILE